MNEKNYMRVKINEQEQIKDIMFIINDVKRTTSNTGILDNPVNVENVIKINIEYGKGNNSTVFIYKRKNKYFIEQPYNGIYRISHDEYNSIEVYVKN